MRKLRALPAEVVKQHYDHTLKVTQYVEQYYNSALWATQYYRTTNLALECEDCQEVLFDSDIYPTATGPVLEKAFKLQSKGYEIKFERIGGLYGMLVAVKGNTTIPLCQSFRLE